MPILQMRKLSSGVLSDCPNHTAGEPRRQGLSLNLFFPLSLFIERESARAYMHLGLDLMKCEMVT